MFLCYFLIGAICGSFGQCFAYDWAYHQVNLMRRSQCDFCNQRLRWFHLIPVLSSLWFRFRCDYCGQYLGRNYFWGELLSGISFCLIYILFPSDSILWHLLWFITILLMILMDQEAMWVPDTLQLLAVFLLLINQSYSLYFTSFCYVGFLLIVFYFLSPEKIGGADIKLMISLSLLVSPYLLAYYFFGISTVGLISWLCHNIRVRQWNQPFPFILSIIIGWHLYLWFVA